MYLKSNKMSADIRFLLKRIYSEYDISNIEDVTIDMFLFIGLSDKMCSMYGVRELVSEDTINSALSHACEMNTSAAQWPSGRFLVDFINDSKDKSIDVLYRVITRVDDYRRIFGSVSKPKRKSDTDGKSSETSEKKDHKNEKKVRNDDVASSMSKQNDTISAKGVLDITQMAEDNQVAHFYGGEEKYCDMFSIFTKKSVNNVIVTGGKRSGKTTFVRNIANEIVSRNVPECLKNAKVFQLDLFSIMTTSLRNSVESTINSIISAAERSSHRLILLIDNADDFFSTNSRFGESGTDGIFNKILNCGNINLVFAINKTQKKNVLSYNRIENMFITIDIDDILEYEDNESIRRAMAGNIGWKNFSFSDEIVDFARKLSMTEVESSRFSMICDILDLACAKRSNDAFRSDEIRKIESELSSIQEEIDSISGFSTDSDDNRYDELAREHMRISNQLKNAKKKIYLDGKLTEMSKHDINSSVTRIFNIGNTSDIPGETKKKRLKSIESELKKKIVGQDEHIDIVCRAVKRKLMGLSDEKKPISIFIAGSTGVGKTLLAKSLSNYIYGDVKSIVRLDMSEYSDKMSVNKLYGSSPGYVGYEEGGVLTNSIKNNPKCILLLDEIEKAHDDVFNVFLQVFDEGRLTDNKGGVVDFSNVIIIMTSNIGSYESEMAKRSIGFARTDIEELSRSAIKNAMKKRFKPEFINRIDEVVFFNSLTDDDKKRIITIELEKVYERIEQKGFFIDRNGISEILVGRIMKNIEDEREYGARPVVREVQRCLQDVVVDYIIENDPECGFTFSKELIV